MNTQKLKFTLTELKEIVGKWLHMEDAEVVDVIMATHLANQLEADPLWVIIIGPPSNTKTELLRAFDGHKNAHFLSTLTPATLVSGKPRKGGGEPSLLPKLTGKTLILKDFTTILSMRSENQQEVLSQFREIYDGQFSKSFGTGKTFEWKGRIGLLAACTPVYDRHYSVIGSLGDRFMLYRTETSDGHKMGLQAQRVVGREVEMRTEIKTAVHRFLDQFKFDDGLHFEKDEKVNLKIVDLSCFVAYARCPVDRDRYSRTVEYLPLPEGPARLVKQFMQIGMGLALARGKRIIDEGIYGTLRKIGRDLITAQRLKVLEYLFQEKAFEYLKEWRSTKNIAEATNTPSTTAKLQLENLMVVGLLNRRRADDSETAPYQWQYNEKASDMIEASEIFRDDVPF